MPGPGFRRSCQRNKNGRQQHKYISLYEANQQIDKSHKYSKHNGNHGRSPHNHRSHRCKNENQGNQNQVIKCPPSILANNRIIKAIGLVNTPKISMTGIIGTGHFNQVGTSGQKISFQYPLRPEKLTTTKVHTANTKVTDIFPARLAPPGKNNNQAHQIHQENKEK